jgi:tripartite-type tricarboxylate transporter receptor subunit TctC
MVLVNGVAPRLAAGAFLVLFALACAAQQYPSKPIRLIAGSSPGSGVDIVARIVAQKLGEQLGQQVVVDNRAGAGGNMGAELAAHAAPDGYTLVIGTPSQAINGALYRLPGYDLQRDFAPISQVTSGQYVIVVHPALGVKSVSELVAAAKAKPGKLNYASGGTGNVTHLAGELFKSMTGTDLLHVPYKGTTPALTDVIGGHAQVMFANLTSAMPGMKSGRLVGLAVTGEKRAAVQPQLPTVIESGVPGYTVISWFGVLAPARTPAAIVTRLHSELERAMRSADVRERLEADAAEPIATSPQQFAAFIKGEIAKWSRVVREAGIKVE